MVKARRCKYCGQALPRELRADAVYCPGSRCRVYAHRRRELLGLRPAARRSVALEMFRPVTGESAAKQLLSALQRKRRHAKLPPLLHDPYLQAQAEELACETMSERVSNLEYDAQSRSYKHSGGYYYWDRDDEVLSNLAKIKLNSNTTHIGLYVIPYDLGGGVVLCTAKKPER